MLASRVTPYFIPGTSVLGSLFRDYSSIADTGHCAAHAPQSTQASASITYCPSPSDIADTGHSASHDPQLIHASVIVYAILLPPYYMKLLNRFIFTI